MQAIIITIGDELLIGQIVNTNASWIGEQLSLLDIDVLRVLTIGDEEAEIHHALRQAVAEVEVVIITGGLGPTHDDVTKKAVASFQGVNLKLDEEVLGRLEAYFKKKYGRLPKGNREIALVPEGFDVLDNSVGTAPGLWGVHRKGQRETRIVILPGVPPEMKALMNEVVLPRLRQIGEHPAVRRLTLLTAGIGESNLSEKLGDVQRYLNDGYQLAYLPNARTGVRVRLTARGETEAQAEVRLARFETFVRECIGPYIYGTNSDSLEAVVGQLLRDRGLTVAFAESCTGGLTCSRMTDIAGSSAYVCGGVVAYSNGAKVALLGVESDVLRAEGAVSEAVVRQMAEGVRVRFRASLGVAITGVAGPTGGTPDKPVGTVWVAYADAKQTIAVRLQLVRDRLLNKELATTFALDLIRRSVPD